MKRDFEDSYSVCNGEMRKGVVRGGLIIICLARFSESTGGRLRQIFQHSALLGLSQHGFNGLD
jgi:hypothetical protein